MRKLSFATKILLAVAPTMAVAGPISIGEVEARAAQAQQAPPTAPAFEVASVKPTPPSATSGRYTGGPGTDSPKRFIATNCPLSLLLLKAYDLKSYQIVGPPSINRDRYDIFANIPPGATAAQIHVMLRNLLVERFGLAVHREKRNLSVYELVVAKGGPKMKEAPKTPNGEQDRAAPGSGTAMRPPGAKLILGKDGIPVPPPGTRVMMAFPVNGVMRVTARGQTVEELIRLLEREVDRPVVDRTGLTGAYDFDLSYAMHTAPEAPAGAAASAESFGQSGSLTTASEPAPTLFGALQGQLGLRLESNKVPVEVLVVDKVNRKPIEN
jgi:uncharacterized protein (TIGR03435 family)